jgi:protein SCO1
MSFRLFLFIIALAVSNYTLKWTANACEHHKHENLTSKNAELPGGSIYHLQSRWTNQNGETRKLSDLAGKPRLVAMVFTRCKTACPVIVQNIRELESQVPGGQMHVDLFSFDSKRENQESLKKFAEEKKFDERWAVYTAKEFEVAELAGALGVQYKQLPSGDFVHANVIFLVNAKGEVVAKKEGFGATAPTFLTALKEAAKY